jgi:hypothetical protein
MPEGLLTARWRAAAFAAAALHSGGLSFLCVKLLAALFVDAFSGEFSFLGCFSLSLFLYKGGI